MASLKDINASIEEGNENTEKLNANFAKWLKSQQTSGDDLEAAREAKRSTSGMVKNTFITNNRAAKTGGMPMDWKKFIVPAAILAAPIIWKMFKDEIRDFLTDLFPKIPTGSPISEEIEFTGKGLRTVGQKFANRQKFLADRAAARKLAASYNQRGDMGKKRARFLADRLAARKLEASYNQRGDMKANQRTRFLTDRTIQPGRRVGDGGLGRAADTITRAKGVGERGSARQDVNMKSGSGVRFNPKLAGGGRYQNINTGKIVSQETANRMNAEYKARVAADKANTKANSTQNKNSKLRKLLQGSSSLVKNVNVGLGNKFRQYNEGMKLPGMPSGKIPNPNTFRGTTVAFGDAVITFLSRLPAPGFAKKAVKILLHPSVLRFIGSKLVLMEVGMILFGYAIDYRNLGSGEPVITRTNYSIAEKIYFLSLFFAGIAMSILGAAIGAAIGTFVLGGVGTIGGGLLGMWLGFQAPYKIMEFVINWAMGNGKIYSKELLEFKAQRAADMKKFAESRSASGMIGVNASPAGMANYDAGKVGSALLSSQGAGTGQALSATLDQNSPEAILQANRNEGAMSTREGAFGGFAMGRNDKKASIAAKIKKSIFSGVNALSSMFGFSSAAAGTAGTGGFTTVGNVHSLPSGIGGDLNAFGGSGAPMSTNVTANSGNTTSSVTTVVSGGNGLNTIDTYVLQPGFNISHSMYTGSSRGQYN